MFPPYDAFRAISCHILVRFFLFLGHRKLFCLSQKNQVLCKEVKKMGISFGHMSELEIENLLMQRRARRACWGAVFITMGLIASMTP